MKEESSTDKDFSEKVELINLWFKIILISAIIVVFLVKIIITPFNILSLDFNELLSLILALFAISSSAMFYFKANEISNKFYDNTYNFMQQVSIILERIEAGFGERLKHLDEGYSEFRNRNFLSQNNDLGIEKVTIANVKAEEKEEKEKEKEKDQIIQERDRIIQQLLDQSKIESEKKDEIAEALKNKDEELQNTQNDLIILRNNIRRQLSEEEIIKKRNLVKNYFLKNYLKYFLPVRENLSSITIKKIFFRYRERFDRDWLLECQILGLVNSNNLLTNEGVDFFREVL